MFEKIKNRVFPFIIALSALSVSASAAFYSVSGLMKLFAGAAFAVGIMAASLEISKLVIASLLYQYWSTLNKALRVYLIVAVSILILITSMGIYGFLSSAYQETANKDQVVTQQITALETKKKLYEDTRDNILKEKQSLSDLRGSLSKGSTTQYTDNKGNLVVRSNNASIKQLDKASQSDDKLSSKIDIVNDSIFSIENKILEIKTNSTSASELGPLKYLSGLTGVSMDRIINYLLLVIIFVFDPLAIALVIAANFAFEKLKQKELLDEIAQKDQEMDLYDEKDLREMKDWEEASLTDLQNYEDYTKEYEIYKKENYNPTPEPEITPEPEPIKQEEDDWVIVDEDAEREKEIEAAIDKIESLTNDISSAEHFKKQSAMEEIRKLKKFLKSNNKDDTITYF
jgi:hypothetical protein